jgi:hypothetical protein
VHLLNAVRAGDVRLRSPSSMRSSGCSAASVGPSANGSDSTTPPTSGLRLLDGVDRWRRRAEHPMSSLDVSRASLAIARTYEGLLART